MTMEVTPKQILSLPERNEKDVHYSGVFVGVPTFGKVSSSFMWSTKTIQAPIFCNITGASIVGKPVDVARSEFASFVMKNNLGFLFFQDDDTIPPGDALIKLLERFSHKEKLDPFNNASMIVGGVVYSKAQPPVPMIHRVGATGGFEDWAPGDLVECECIGMGCTIIPVGLFFKLEPFITEYRCVNYDCPEPWGCYEKGDGKCPRCHEEMVPGFFKTVRCASQKGDLEQNILCTEDSYFCMLIKKHLGAKVYADCGVLCEHEVFDPDPRKCTYYGYYGNIGPGWRQGTRIYYYPDVTHTTEHQNCTTQLLTKQNGTHNGPVKFNLGAGKCNLDGYINIDASPTVNADFVCDARMLRGAVEKYGRPEEIRADHLLEHFERDEIIGVIRHWLLMLKPGGLLVLEVPDGEKAAEEFLKSARDGERMDHWPEMVIFGRRAWPGDDHKTIFYDKKIDALMEACKNQIESYEIEKHAKDGKVVTNDELRYSQAIIKIRITKKGVDVPDEESVDNASCTDAKCVQCGELQ